MTSPPEDDDPLRPLIEKIQAGIDREANCERLYKLLYPTFYRFFFLRKRFSEDESRDLTQESLFRVFNGIDTFRRESRSGGWLFEIAANVYKNEIRKRRTSKRDAQEESLESALENDPKDLVGRGGIGSPVQRDTLDGIVEKERLNAVRAALAEMSPQMRTCCELRYIGGYKYREIAVLMKISIGTVKAHLAQAKKKLKEILGEAAEEE